MIEYIYYSIKLVERRVSSDSNFNPNFKAHKDSLPSVGLKWRLSASFLENDLKHNLHVNVLSPLEYKRRKLTNEAFDVFLNHAFWKRQNHNQLHHKQRATLDDEFVPFLQYEPCSGILNYMV